MNAKAFVVMVILLIAIGAGGFYFGQNYKLVPASTPSLPTPTQGLTPQTPTSTPSVVTLAPTVDETSSIITAVKAGLIAEHGASAGAMNVTVSKIQGNYAKGGAVDPESVGGAMWLAVKTGGAWKLVWDGNGTISCTLTTQYPDFPKVMIPECWDETTQKSITR